MSRPLLSIRGAVKRFGSTLALAAVDAEIAEGEFVCLVGPSGCGKSTLLGLVAGLDRASEGEILLAGERIVAPGPDRGMVFQRDSLFPWLSVRENVRFGLGLAANAPRPDGPPVDLAFADHLVAEIGLWAFRDAHPKALSGGMRQRVAIARALVTRPRMLLMDEPFGALDAQTRETMQDLLLALVAEQRTTVLFVTHDVEEAVFLGDRVVVMRAHPGEVIATIEVDLPRPRGREIKLDPVFSGHRGRILRLIHESAAPAHA